MSDQLRILQISNKLNGGGAERVAADLHLGLLDRGHEAWLAVGTLNGDVRGALQVPMAPTSGLEALLRRHVAEALEPLAARAPALRRVQRVARHPGAIRRRIDRWRGREALEYPGSRGLLEVVPGRPDVVHCHNLHGGYFDLRYLPGLASVAPLMLTLHDEWLFTGHCAYSLGCERWRTGCGQCPDLTIYPAVTRDATAANRRVKASIYRRSRFHVSAPSSWLIERAKASILAEGALDFRVIRNGVDRSVFKAGDRQRARERLGIPMEAHVLLCAANLIRTSAFKDHETMFAAARKIGGSADAIPTIAIALGEDGPVLREGRSEMWQLAYESDRDRMADHYRAADAYLHGAHADNAPMTIAEALSCGTPVVAAAVGGIPEMVHSLAAVPGAWDGVAHPATSATGILVPPRDADAMAAATTALLADPNLRTQLAGNALRDSTRFGLDRQVSETIAWYHEAIAERSARQTRHLAS